MTHKQECIRHCHEYLNSRNLTHVYNQHLFEHYYRKNSGHFGNAYSVGIKAGDLMINNYEPKLMEVNHDRSNENETGAPERA